MREISAVGIKEFRQIRRDRRTLMILLFIPVFFLLLYGYALNFDIRHIRIAVEDRDHSPESRTSGLGVREFDLLRSGRVGHERIRGRPTSWTAIGSRAALVIPKDFARRHPIGPAGLGRGADQR